MSLPLGLRLGLTVPVVVLEALLIRSLIRTASADDPRGAALVLFLIGSIAAICVPVLREVWRSTVEWKQARAREGGERRTLDDQLRVREPLPQFRGFESEPGMSDPDR